MSQLSGRAINSRCNKINGANPIYGYMLRMRNARNNFTALTRIVVVSIHECWFFHKMLGSKILGVVIQFASLVGKVVV